MKSIFKTLLILTTLLLFPPIAEAEYSLLNEFNQTPVAGRTTDSLPLRAQFTNAARTWHALKFLPRTDQPAGGGGLQLFNSLLLVGRGWFVSHSE